MMGPGEWIHRENKKKFQVLVLSKTFKTDLILEITKN